MPPVPRGCSEKRLLGLLCKWKECDEPFALPASSYQDFSEHVFRHVKDYLSSVGFSQYDIANQVTKNEDGADWSLVTPLTCSWSECNWELRGGPDEFSRHVLFHAYHAKLKCLGAFAVISEGLRQCSFDVETSDLLPDVSEAFVCKWEGCDTQFLCPDKFYRHVDLHGYAAHREDVLVTTGEKTKPDVPESNEKEFEELQVQTMTQSVCRWDGCSYLARDPWKIKEHCRIHTGEKLVACPGCGLFFANKTKFTDHLIRQDTAQYEHFQCSHCLKRCASERLLRDHMRHHVNHVKCPHCDMTCPNPSSLRSHLKFKHSLDRPFKCSMCNFSCKTKYDLSRHEGIHFDKTCYCEHDGCSFECRNASALRAHVKAVHQKKGARQYMCHICRKQLSRGFLLTRHLKKEHHFSWPSGHSRFRYKLDEDGYYRLQMVRFESAELTEQLSRENPDIDGFCDNLESNENVTLSGAAESNGSPSDQELTVAEDLAAISSTHSNDISHSQEICTARSASEENGEAVSVSLNDRYEALLRLYEMARDNDTPVLAPMEEESGLLQAEEAMYKVTGEDGQGFYHNRSKRKKSPKKLKTFH